MMECAYGDVLGDQGGDRLRNLFRVGQHSDPGAAPPRGSCQLKSGPIVYGIY